MLCIFPVQALTEAVECSLKLRPAFATLVKEWKLPAETELEIGLGLGEVAIGTFGHNSLQMKDVFGEEIDLAATIGHHRGIALTERLHAEIEAHYQTRPLPDLKVKWQETPLKIWEVVE
jgi:class 3 adenylate cyclase